MRSDDERLRDIVEHADLIGAHLPASPDDGQAGMTGKLALPDRFGGEPQ